MPAGALSHGQKQWLEIGMLLIQDQQLLLLDEPVAGMTDHETEATAELFLSLAGKRTVVVVEHDMEFVRSLGARVTVLHEGTVLAEGTIDHVQNDRASSRSIWGAERCSRSRTSTCTTAPATSCATSASSPRRARSPACSAATASARPRCSRAHGLLPIRGGRITVGGQRHHRAAAARARAARHRATCRRAARSFRASRSRRICEIGLAPLPRASARIPDEIFALFPVLRDMLRRRGGDLSGGQQQQLAIARALVTQPRLLILDEPTEGIQPSIIKDIERVIRELAARGDMAILLVEQYFEFARALADRYVVMERGEVVLVRRRRATWWRAMSVAT